jgi:hypothetical protein
MVFDVTDLKILIPEIFKRRDLSFYLHEFSSRQGRQLSGTVF